MPAGVPGRMLVPLAVLGVAGTLRSRLQLRLLTLLAQREFPEALRALRGGGYDFEMRRYGPRCSLLDRDMSGSPWLVEHGVEEPSHEMSRFVHLYRITGEGRRCLGVLKAGADPGTISAMEGRITGLLSGMPAALMEEAYGGLFPGESAEALGAAVEADLARVGPPIRRAYEEFGSGDAASLASTLKMVGTALSESDGAPAAQRRAVLCVSGEIVGECDGLAGGMGERDDPRLGPRIRAIDDLAYSLARYCEKRGIMRDPMTRPLGEMIGAEDVRSLWAELRKEYPAR